MILATTRPDSWALPLFLHVFGAMALAGGMTAVTVLAWAGLRRPERAALARGAFWATLAVAVPSWIVMRGAAEWIYSREGYDGHNDPNWIGVGFGVSDVGLLVLLRHDGPRVLVVAARQARAGRGAWSPCSRRFYLALLAVAWWVMSAKPGSSWP